MPRLTAYDHVDADVVQMLRSHAAERDRILGLLTVLFELDRRVRAAWLWGSFLRGDSDDLSDLDIWLLVPAECVGGFAAVIKSFCEAAGNVVSSGENPHNAPPDGRYLGALIAGSHGLHHLDIYWQCVTAGALPEGPVLFNRLDELPVDASPAAEAAPARDDSPLAQCRGKLSFIWLMLSVTAKYLARDPASDMALIAYPRNSFEECIVILDLQNSIGEVNWTAPGEPLAKVDFLRLILEKTAVLEQACRTCGLDISTEANPCLSRYLDMVEGIVRGSSSTSPGGATR